jgi:hypothetical protein
VRNLLTKRTAVRLIGALFLMITLNGCYFPIRFDIEVDISRQGFYKIVFDGYIVHVALYQGLREGKINSAEEQKKVADVKTDITRDSAASEFRYFNKGRFRVHWEKEGDITRQKFVTFMRRNASFFSIKYNKEKFTIELAGTSLSSSQKKQLRAIGLDMVGEIRIKTDGRVVKHNATQTGTPTKFYIWKIDGMSKPSPKMVISLI